MRFPRLAVMLCAVVGCSMYAPSVGSVPLSQTKYEPRSADYPITLLTSTVPTCPYDEVATVTASPPILSDHGASSDTLLSLLRTKARSLGGDAVIHLRNIDDKDEKNIFSNGTHFSREYTGTVIRYRDTNCKK